MMRTRSFGALVLVLVVGGALSLASSVLTTTQPAVCFEDQPEDQPIVLINGQILTMDDANTVAQAVRIDNGRITVVDEIGSTAGACVVDLGGRTVIPGLIDTHVHFLQNSMTPGHMLAGTETAASIPEWLDLLAARTASVPAGEFITVIGEIRAIQFAENRLPTLGELDEAAPDHPVYLQDGMNGPAVTNTLGKQYFESRGASVGQDGSIGRQATGSAMSALLRDQTEAEAKRAAAEYMAYANSLGLTTMLDISCCFWSNARGLGFGIDTAYEIWRDGDLNVRLRLRFGGGGSAGADGVYPSVASAEAQLSEIGAGDEMLQFAGVGEFTVGQFGQTDAPFEDAFGQVAERGWSLAQHSLNQAEHEAHIQAFEAVNANTPIAELHWSLDHAWDLTTSQLIRMRAIGAGISASTFAYWRTGTDGPPFRDMIDQGVQVGMSSDASNIGPLNPWIFIYYMVTGKNVTGQTVNAGQQITRLEALRLYTQGAAWFSMEEDELGSIEVGKWADLVVLSDDVLTVPEEDLLTLSSVLTLLGGRVVYAAGEFESLAGQP